MVCNYDSGKFIASQFKDNIVDQIFDSDDVIEDTQTDLGTE